MPLFSLRGLICIIKYIIVLNGPIQNQIVKVFVDECSSPWSSLLTRFSENQAKWKKKILSCVQHLIALRDIGSRIHFNRFLNSFSYSNADSHHIFGFVVTCTQSCNTIFSGKLVNVVKYFSKNHYQCSHSFAVNCVYQESADFKTSSLKFHPVYTHCWTVLIFWLLFLLYMNKCWWSKSYE